MNLEQNEGKEFDIDKELDGLDGVEEKPFTIPDEWINEEDLAEIESSNEKEKQVQKEIEKICSKKDEEDFDIEKALDDLDFEEGPQPLKSPDLTIDEEIDGIGYNKPEKEKPADESYLIEKLETQPEYTGNYILGSKFPKAAFPSLIKIYQKKASVGKLFDIIIVEAAKRVRRKVGMKTHEELWKHNNIWIPLSEIYKRTYRDVKRKDIIHESLFIIAKELDGKLKYNFVVKGRIEYLVLNIVHNTILEKANDIYISADENDYKLTAAELIFFRQIQIKMGKGQSQNINNSTLMGFGEFAWHFDKSKSIQHKKAEECLKKLYDNKRVWQKQIKNTQKISIVVVNPENIKQVNLMKNEW